MNINLEINREKWLTQSAELITSLVFEPAIKAKNITIEPDTKIAVSIGHPKSKQAIGECWPRAASEDGATNQIFITPFSSDSLRILDVLVHEMAHAFDDNKNGHKGRFALLARAVGLEGKLTATVAGAELTATLENIVDVMGPIPHTKLDENLNGRKKQKGRMIKVECSACEFKFNTSRTQIGRMQLDCTCPVCSASGTMAASIESALAGA